MVKESSESEAARHHVRGREIYTHRACAGSGLGVGGLYSAYERLSLGEREIGIEGKVI